MARSKGVGIGDSRAPHRRQWIVPSHAVMRVPCPLPHSPGTSALFRTHRRYTWSQTEFTIRPAMQLRSCGGAGIHQPHDGRALLPLGIRQSGTIPGVDELSDLEYHGHWRIAVWALRVGFVGLAVAVAGLIAMSLGSRPWVLTVGVIIWLAAAVVVAAGFLRSRHELPDPRPGFWSMRCKLIHDTIHVRSSAQRP